MRDLADSLLESQQTADEAFVAAFNEAMQVFNASMSAALAARQIAAVAALGAHEQEVNRRMQAFNGESGQPSIDAGAWVADLEAGIRAHKAEIEAERELTALRRLPDVSSHDFMDRPSSAME